MPQRKCAILDIRIAIAKVEYRMLSIATRLSSYYAAMFFSFGAVLPYAALWFDLKGFTATEIGVVFAVPAFLVVGLSFITGRWADQLKDWRTALIIFNSASLAVVAVMPFLDSVLMIGIAWTMGGVFIMLSSPIMDGASLSLTQRKKLDYGRIRAWGGIGFLAGVMITGIVFERLGREWFLVVLIGVSTVRWLAAIRLPSFRGEAKTAAATAAERHALWHPGFLLVIIGAALLGASHSFYNVFAVKLWTDQGLSATIGSWLWITAVSAEILIMRKFAPIARRVSARACLIIAAAIACFRWTLTGIEPALGTLFALQALHAITFGIAFLASVNFISRRVNDSVAARAQAILATIMTLGMGISNLVAGLLYERMQSTAYWAMAILALSGGILVAISFRTSLTDKRLGDSGEQQTPQAETVPS